MRALSIQQPAILCPESYIAGVLHGDGWITDKSLGLRCKDYDFAEVFAGSLRAVRQVDARVRIDERGFALVRFSNKSGRFNGLKEHQPISSEEKAHWLRGLFDSEGNACFVHRRGKTAGAFERRISFYSTHRETITAAESYLSDLGMKSAVRLVKASAGHIGTKPVYELRLKRRLSFERFAQIVGSSIERKHSTITRMVDAYQDPSKAARSAQLLGAAAKHAKLMNVTLPAVINGVATLISNGMKPTHRNCRSVKGFDSVRRYFSQDEIIAMASKEISECAA